MEPCVLATHVPANPVKFTFRAVEFNEFKNVRAYVPPVKLNEMLLASDEGLLTPTVIDVEPVLVTLMTGVPVTVKDESP
jgi:hypothetical protein